MGRARRTRQPASALRRRAESRLRARRAPAPFPEDTDLRRIVHELEVHRVELELQNEQLRTTQAELATTRDRYASLFDLAPTGYLVLDPVGAILDANAAACRLLERPRHLLRGRNLVLLLGHEDRPAFVRHLAETAANPGRPWPIEVSLAGSPARIVRLETVSQPGSEGEARHHRTAMIDITEQVRAEQRLRAERTALERSQAALRELTHRLMAAEENERRRIAADLHDDIGQRLHAVQVELALLGRRPAGQAGSGRTLRTVRRHLEELVGDLEGLARTLHPKIVDDLGLRVALKAHAEEVGRQARMRVRFRERAVPGVIPRDAATCLYRVAQEALRNVRRHAAARAATVTLARVGHGLGLCIADGGRGFDPEQARLSGVGLGLVTMNERVGAFGGHFRVRASPGDGTHVHAWVPLP